jgi:hypothetical protein
VDRKRRDALRAQRDDIADRQNQYGSGQPDDMAGAAKGRPLRPQGNSRACILRRLRRDYPALHALVLNGTLSPHRAAITAGFRKPPGRKPKRRPVDPSEITREQEMELWLGAGHRGSVFSSEDERREAWTRHRDRLMELWGQHGRRPMAWWCYEAGELDYPGYDFERSTLFEAGRLTEPERAELLAYWKHEFDRACVPGFFICLGPGRFLANEEACAAHCRWADIPASLVEQWMAERRRQTVKEKPPREAAEGLESS